MIPKKPKLISLAMLLAFLLTFFCCIFINMNTVLAAETINYFNIPTAAKLIKKTFFIKKISKTTRLPIKNLKNIKSMQVTGKVNLKGEDSFARVVLVDTNKKEYLIFDSSSNFSNKLKYDITNHCEETCILEKPVTPKELFIEVNNAEITINSVGSLDEKKDFLSSIKTKIKTKGIANIKKEFLVKQTATKLSSLKKLKTQKKLTWEAGETELSKMSYQEKKKLFSGHVPNLQGLEFYKSGIFILNPSRITPVAPNEEDFVKSWDWRNRQGYNYITPVKDQRPCASCWDFSVVSATEANANIYFNNPNLDLDISEQEMLFLPPTLSTACRDGGFVEDTYNQLATGGLVKEECMPYEAIDESDVQGNNALAVYKRYACQDLVKIKNFTAVPNTDLDIKYNLVTKGPLTFGIPSWWHFMTLVGYYEISLEPFANKKFTIWIIKNSWGDRENNKGYIEMIVPVSDRYGLYSVETDPTLWQINCEDRDNDSYCNWGFPSTPKPASCAAKCKTEMDCDDSNPMLGAFDKNYNCVDLLDQAIESASESAGEIVEDVFNSFTGDNSGGSNTEDSQDIPASSNTAQDSQDIPTAPVATPATPATPVAPVEPAKPAPVYGTDKNPSIEVTLSNDGLATYTVNGVINYYGTAKGCDQPRYFDPVIVRWVESATEITPTSKTFSATHKFSVKNPEYEITVSVVNSCFQSTTKRFTVYPKLK